MTGNVKLSLVIIFRRPPSDFEKRLEDMIRLSGADELVLLNTGPDDPLQEQEGTTVYGVPVRYEYYSCPLEFEHEGKRYIGDFAAARDAAHKYATGNWHLTLDADDELVCGAPQGTVKGWLEVLLEQKPGTRAVSAVYDYLPGVMAHRRLRLIRKEASDSWRWEGQLHEQIVGDSHFSADTYNADSVMFKVIHHGNPSESAARNQALIRNLTKYLSLDELSPAGQLAAASVAYFDGDLFRAAELASRVYRAEPHTTLGYLAALNYASVCHSLGDLCGAVELLGEVIASAPDRQEARVMLADIRRKTGDLRGAAKEYRDAFFAAKADPAESDFSMQLHAAVAQGRLDAIDLFCELEDYNTAIALGGVAQVNKAQVDSLKADSLAEIARVWGKIPWDLPESDRVKELLRREPPDSPRGRAWALLSGSPREHKVIGPRQLDSLVAQLVFGNVGYVSSHISDLPNHIGSADADGEPLLLTEVQDVYDERLADCNCLVIEGHAPPCAFPSSVENVFELLPPGVPLEAHRGIHARDSREFEDGWKLLHSYLFDERSAIPIHILAPGPILWGPQAHLKRGIGGSEQAVIHLAPILARSNVVHVWAHRLEKPAPTVHEGVWWHSADAFDERQMQGEYGATIVWRAAEALPQVKRAAQGVPLIYWAHDVPRTNDAPHLEHADKILVLSDFHRELFEELGVPRKKIIKTRNGIAKAAVTRAWYKDVERDPHACIYASSPVRGLLWLLEMWPDVRREVPDATLHVCTDLVPLTKPGAPARAKKLAQQVLQLLFAYRKNGVVYHRALSHPELLDLERRVSVWANPSPFYEVSCITAMEMQALGVELVTSDTGALKETCFKDTTRFIPQETLLAESGLEGLELSSLKRTGELWTSAEGFWQESFWGELIEALCCPRDDPWRAKLSARALDLYDWSQVAGDFLAALGLKP